MNQEQTAEVLEQDGLAEETQGVVAEAEESGDTSANEGDSEHKKRLGGWQRKIQKLERQNETLMELVRTGGKTADAREQTQDASDKPPVKPAKPRKSDFDTWEKYESAMDKYEDDRDAYHDANLAYQLRKADGDRQQKFESQTIADGFATQVAEAREEHPDFDDVAFSQDIPMSKPMMDAIVTSEVGAHIAYELGKNPDLAARIARMNPHAAIREIGKIESKIETRIADKESAEGKTQETRPATTRAPKPPATVRRGTTSNAEPSDDDDYKTWERKRNAQIKARNG